MLTIRIYLPSRGMTDRTVGSVEIEYGDVIPIKNLHKSSVNYDRLRVEVFFYNYIKLSGVGWHPIRH